MNHSTPRTRNLAPACFAIFLFGFFCAFAQFSLGLHSAGFGPGFEVSNVARHLADSGDFSDPFSVPTGATAHVAPGYTAVLALAFRTFGFSHSAVLALLLLNVTLLALGAALLPLLSQRVFGHPAAGIAGGILLAVSGKLMPQNEVAFSAVLLLATTLLLLSRGRLVAGLLSAASILTNPIAVLPIAVVGLSRGRRWFAAAGGLALLLCLPWIVRNYIVLGSLSFVRDNFGLELYLSNHDQANPEMGSNPLLWKLHPTYSATEAAQVATQGEGAYNREKLGIAVNWIRHHPQRFLYLSAARVFRYWFPSIEEGAWASYGCQLITLLAIPGVWLARKNSTAMLLALAAVCYSLPYAVIETDLKYVYPMLWVSALLAGYTIHTVLLELSKRVRYAGHSRG